MNKNILLTVLIFPQLFFAAPCASAQSTGRSDLFFSRYNDNENIAAGHTGKINDFDYDGNGTIFSVDSNGFLAAWDVYNNTAIERFQLVNVAIENIVCRPNKTQFAISGTDENGRSFIVVWDYIKKAKLFTRTLNDNVSFINYSLGGSYLLVTSDAQNSLQVLDAEKGTVLQSSFPEAAICSFAATGPSEKSIAAYSDTGKLLYYERSTRTLTTSFTIRPNLKNVFLFGARRFFAGMSGGVLYIYNAVSGKEIAALNNIANTCIFPIAEDSSSFAVISNDGKNRITFYEANNQGQLNKGMSREINNDADFSKAVIAESYVIASISGEYFQTAPNAPVTGGLLMSIDDYGFAKLMAANNNNRIISADITNDGFAFLSENGLYGILPYDFKTLKQDGIIPVKQNSLYDSVAANIDNDVLLFYQTSSNGISLAPLVINRKDGSEYIITMPSSKYTLRCARIEKDKILLLDTAGNITILNIDDGSIIFTYTASGTQDAVFYDDNTILISHIGLSGSLSTVDDRIFLLVNILTGETVPINYTAIIGMSLFNVPGNKLYGTLIRSSNNRTETVIVNLNVNNPGQSSVAETFAGEESNILLCEYKNALVSTLGTDNAHINQGRSKREIERSGGLPVKLFSSIYLQTIDGDGNLCYYDDKGKLQASIKIYNDRWVLTAAGEKITGPLVITRD